MTPCGFARTGASCWGPWKACTSWFHLCLRRVSRDPLMKICKTIDDMRATSRGARRSGKRLGFVPTMGALHEGHLSLVRAAKAKCDVVAVSIFVNPLQFGPSEDLDKYPRTLQQDEQALKQLGVELLFIPSAKEMYSPGAKTH